MGFFLVSWVLSFTYDAPALAFSGGAFTVVPLATLIGLSIFYIPFYWNEDVDVRADAIGGACVHPPLLTWARLSRTKQLPLVFVAASDADVERSNKRSFYDRLKGAYGVYDTQGSGFRFVRSYFSRRDFDTIRANIRDVYGIDYS